MTTHFNKQNIIDFIEHLRQTTITIRSDSVSCLIIEKSDKNVESGINSVIDNIIWKLNNNRNSEELKLFLPQMWQKWYEEPVSVKSNIYSDVIPFIEKHKSVFVNGIYLKFWTISKLSAKQQKFFLNNSVNGEIVRKYSLIPIHDNN